MIYIPTTATVWTSWTTSSASVTSTGGTDTFYYWLSEGTATTTTSSTIYGAWIEEYNNSQVVRAVQLQRSIEQEAQRQREIQEQSRRYAEQQKQKAEARRKAKIILLESLNMEQFKDFHKEGHFFVKSPSGRLYRIREGRSINIDLMKGNSRVDIEKRLCAHPEILCPNEDTMLVQKIYLENLEQEFLRIAKQYDPVRH